MQAFAQFASDLDKATQAQLARGARLVELLKQGQYSPVPVAEQVIAIFAGTNGYVDGIETSDVGRYERELMAFLRGERKSVLEDITSKGKIDDDLKAELKDALDAFGKVFETNQEA
jgi:F-type H+-transporting ATPase subunit alpha